MPAELLYVRYIKGDLLLGRERGYYVVQDTAGVVVYSAQWDGSQTLHIYRGELKSAESLHVKLTTHPRGARVFDSYTGNCIGGFHGVPIWRLKDAWILDPASGQDSCQLWESSVTVSVLRLFCMCFWSVSYELRWRGMVIPRLISMKTGGIPSWATLNRDAIPDGIDERLLLSLVLVMMTAMEPPLGLRLRPVAECKTRHLLLPG